MSVEENQPEDEKFYLGYHEKYSNKGENSYYYGRIRTTMEMLAKAIDKAGSTNAKAIAHALAGMTHETYYGTVTMRAEDHQLIQPLYISVFTPVGTEGVKYGVDNTGIGWKTRAKIPAEASAMPTSCQMVRPSK